MSDKSGIQWTDATWNPVVGCSKVSEGCRNCYAMNEARRVAVAAGMRPDPTVIQRAYSDVVKRTAEGVALPQWNNEVRCIQERLDEPLRWRKPRRVFVNSMSDLFHPKVPFDFIDRVFAVMALAPRHTFQILTKRPERMAEWFGSFDDGLGNSADLRRRVINEHANAMSEPPDNDYAFNAGWPLRNVWIGTSCEDQASADERVPHLLRCPSAVRFLSCEPLLKEISLEAVLTDPAPVSLKLLSRFYRSPQGESSGFRPEGDGLEYTRQVKSPLPLHWLIVGGESGSGARGCNLRWVRSIVAQCKVSGLPCFVKQLGAAPFDAEVDGPFLMLRDRKGGDPSEWPEDLRVREFPQSGGDA